MNYHFSLYFLLCLVSAGCIWKLLASIRPVDPEHTQEYVAESSPTLHLCARCIRAAPFQTLNAKICTPKWPMDGCSCHSFIAHLVDQRSFDCPVRMLALEYVHKIQPNLSTQKLHVQMPSTASEKLKIAM